MNRVGLIDTSAEASSVLFEVYRRMSPSRKLNLQVVGYSSERVLHEAGRRSRDPHATRDEIHKEWNLLRLGQGPWMANTEVSMDDTIDNLEVVRQVGASFTRLGISYALGDSCYYVSLDAVKEAVRISSTFNIINTIAGFKIDVFVRKDTAFARSMMSRRTLVATEGNPGIDLVMISAEDTILLKLEWYRLGGEISERQWLDVLGVMRVQGDRLDQSYLDRWAGELGVADLLADARRDAVL